MDEIADSIINGDFDEITGEWFGVIGDGYPRTLTSMNYSKKKNLHLKMHKQPPFYSREYYGVWKFLRIKRKKAKSIPYILSIYANHVLKVEPKLMVSSKNFEQQYPQLVEVCRAIQKDFPTFSNWVRSEEKSIINQ